MDRNCTISNEVKDEIRRKLSEMKSFTQIGREENTSISTVMRIFHDIEVPKRKLDYETVYLDEFRLFVKSGEKYNNRRNTPPIIIFLLPINLIYPFFIYSKKVSQYKSSQTRPHHCCEKKEMSSFCNR